MYGVLVRWFAGSLLVVLLINDVLQGQINSTKFQYLFPVPGSKLNSVETNIIIRMGDAYESSVTAKEGMRVTGSRSGLHEGRIVLAEENRTLIFYPEKHFEDDEIVTVELNGNQSQHGKAHLKTIQGESVPPLRYSFETSKVNLNKKIKDDPEKKYNLLFSDRLSNIKNKNNGVRKIVDQRSNSLKQNPAGTGKVKEITLPSDFPSIVVDPVDDPSPGYIFFTPFIFPSGSSFADLRGSYLIITDNYGIPIFYKKMTTPTFDFKKQKTGVLTYFDLASSQFYVMDSFYNIMDSLYTQNYITDLHELEVLEDGHSLMMSYDFQPYAMDTVVAGGDSNATIIGLIIQELDENKNIVFQWRSWDHFKITDATFNYDLTDSLIDYAHGNSIEMDIDGNLLISNRHMDEVTKINRETGEIIWRWGGVHCRNNEFLFINDPIGFSHQHDARRLPNGNIILFDNGNLHEPPFSRVVEYQVDEVNKIATLVWEHRNNPETFSAFMGSSRRLDNHNTFIGWGSHTVPAISEVSADGNVLLSMSLPDTLLNYRAFKSQWKTNLFVANPDSLSFGFVAVGDSVTVPLSILNNSANEIEINGLYNRESAYKIEASLPLVIPASESVVIQVTFNPETEGEYFDELHIRWDSESEGIAQVVPMAGSTIITDIEDDAIVQEYSLAQNYPNPFNPGTVINYQLPVNGFVSLKIYDILGNEVATLVNEVKSSGKYQIKFDANSIEGGLSSGIYFYKLTAVPAGGQAGSFTETKKFVLIK